MVNNVLLENRLDHFYRSAEVSLNRLDGILMLLITLDECLDCYWVQETWECRVIAEERGLTSTRCVIGKIESRTCCQSLCFCKPFVKLNKICLLIYIYCQAKRGAGTPSEFNIQCANREKPSSLSNHKNSTGLLINDAKVKSKHGDWDVCLYSINKLLISQ